MNMAKEIDDLVMLCSLSNVASCICVWDADPWGQGTDAGIKIARFYVEVGQTRQSVVR